MKLLSWFKRLLRKKPQTIAKIPTSTVPVEVETKAKRIAVVSDKEEPVAVVTTEDSFEKLREERRLEQWRRKHRSERPEVRSRRFGKFFKGSKHQLPSYRKSIFADKKAEPDEEDA